MKRTQNKTKIVQRRLLLPWPEIWLIKDTWRNISETLEHHVHALTETSLARRINWRQFCEICVELGHVILGSERRFEGRLQLPVDDVTPGDVLEVAVLLDGLGIGGTTSQSLRRLRINGKK